LSQFNKPKRKKKSRNHSNKPGAPGAAGAANKNKRKKLLLNQVLLGLLVFPNPNKLTPNTGGFNANRSARPGFVKRNRPAIVAK
jgi:translation initiation factor IF-2